MNFALGHIAKLARLSLNSDEKDRFELQIKEVLSYIEKLNELDTEQIDATSHVLSIDNIMREDSIAQSPDIEDILRNAPDREGKFYRVPRIIE